MTESDISSIKRKSLRGVLILFQQTFIIQVIGICSSFVQLAFLTPVEFGIYGIANSLISILSYFTDIGLAGALIQKKEELTKSDLATTFTIQQLLVISIVVIGYLGSSVFTGFYNLDEQGKQLFYVLLFSFFLSSFKTIPAILLERKLDFGRLAIPQILEQVVYNTLLAVLAWQGFGIMSFMWAALARSVVGLVTMFIVSPWRIQIGINKKAAKELFRFGIPYQLNSFLALVKDDLLYLTLGKMFPPQYAKEFMGYIFIAKKLSDLPLRIVLDSVTRVTFPAFSRLQHHKEALTKALNNTTFGIGILIFPIYITGIFFIGPFIDLFPNYAKWEPALLTFYMLSLTQVAASFSTPLVSALNAIGKVKISLMLMIMWIVLTWSLIVPLIPILGLNSFGFSLMIVSLTVFPVIWICNRYIKFSFFQQIRTSFFAGIVLAVWYITALHFLQPSFLIFMIVMVIGGLLYSGIMYTFEKNKITFIVRGVFGK